MKFGLFSLIASVLILGVQVQDAFSSRSSRSSGTPRLSAAFLQYHNRNTSGQSAVNRISPSSRSTVRYSSTQQVSSRPASRPAPKPKINPDPDIAKARTGFDTRTKEQKANDLNVEIDNLRKKFAILKAKDDEYQTVLLKLKDQGLPEPSVQLEAIAAALQVENQELKKRITNLEIELKTIKETNDIENQSLKDQLTIFKAKDDKHDETLRRLQNTDISEFCKQLQAVVVMQQTENQGLNKQILELKMGAIRVGRSNNVLKEELGVLREEIEGLKGIIETPENSKDQQERAKLLQQIADLKKENARLTGNADVLYETFQTKADLLKNYGDKYYKRNETLDQENDKLRQFIQALQQSKK